jgi:2-haloacid dehalogenase
MIVLFDVNGTLTDPAGLGEVWGRPDLGPGILDGALRTAWTDTMVGRYRPLAEHLRGSLVREADRSGLDPALVDAAVERAGRLDPHPDAAGALQRLRAAGVRLAALTNSGADAGRATLDAAGLLGFFDLVLGVDAVEAFKPDPRTYAHAVAELGASPEDVVLVAAHGWDVAGAAAAGLRTGWISRGEVALSPMVPGPDLRARDLGGMADALLNPSR